MPHIIQPTENPQKAKAVAGAHGGQDYVSFIETQFPISKLSKESYKERDAKNGQTLTGLGKWWGRKPLILVRATILGLLLPATDDPRRDREIFLSLLTMDDEGFLRRRNKKFKEAELMERLTSHERDEYETQAARLEAEKDKKLKKQLREEFRALVNELQKRAFLRLSYDEKLKQCDRPENVSGPSEEAWQRIKVLLATESNSMPELICKLGEKRFGRVPRIGDAFCGGGSVPFEAARLGCAAVGTDLNPIATLLTWASLNLVGGDSELADSVRQAQKAVYSAVEGDFKTWGIERNEQGWQADSFLYCSEAICPECGWKVPLAPSWVISKQSNCIARLKPISGEKRFEIEIVVGVTGDEMAAAEAAGTTKDKLLVCPNPNCTESTSIRVLRGDREGKEGADYGLRMWAKADLAPRPSDTFQERLYCIRWEETIYDAQGNADVIRHYLAPTAADFDRDARCLKLLRERTSEWERKGFIPCRKVEPGDETTRLLRERGWTHWHHLFNPRQLLTLGCLAEKSAKAAKSREIAVALMLGLSRSADYNAKLSRWHPRSIGDKSEQVFSNQALNTLFNYATRSLSSISSSFFIEFDSLKIPGRGVAAPIDCRQLTQDCDLWLTDPPYADAVNYHELTEFFLAWHEKRIIELFPEWYADTKRALAVKGSDETFRRSMVDCYRNLAQHMPDDGMQVVMFTHQDAGVWADLALILWTAGLRVTAAWCIATETDSALKEGNYVQGTVLLVLRKQTSEATAFLDELYPLVENQVKAQLESMLKLDDQEDPNFADTDYQLAAYAAALRVLTQYRRVEDFDIAYELSKTRNRNETSPIEAIIADAVKTACDYLVPRGFDTHIWKTLDPMERFYLKGLEVESHGEHRVGVYQELARGFGLAEYRNLLASTKANETRLKTATDFANRELNDTGFGASQVRQVLFAVRETVRTGDAQMGKNWLRAEVKDYWNQRRILIELLRYLGTLNGLMAHWKADSEAAQVLAGAVENDHV